VKSGVLGNGDIVWGEDDHINADAIRTACTIPSSVKTNKETHKTDIDSEELALLSRVLHRSELLLLLQQLPASFGLVASDRHNGKFCVGMVGYPNVGKSSVINSVLGVSKASHGIVRVAVSSTPGKTKHFQTIVVNDGLMLCDCPGLVFPSFMQSVGEMLCSGILPINQMRDFVEAAEIITARVPQSHLEAIYSIPIVRVLDVKDSKSRPPTPSELLGAYCKVKGYIAASSGRWDEFKGCKEVLRDYNDGKVLHVVPPPGSVTSEGMSTDAGRVALDVWHRETEKILMCNEKIRERLESARLRDIDSTYGTDHNEAESVSRQSASVEASGSVFIFEGGDGMAKCDLDNYSEDGVFEYRGEEESMTMIDSELGSGSQQPRREHKRGKRWGKKGKKLRDKDPYADPDNFVAYSTNRRHVTHTAPAIVNKTRSHGM